MRPRRPVSPRTFAGRSIAPAGVLCLALCFFAGCVNYRREHHPALTFNPAADTLFGRVVVDQYRALEDYSDPLTQEWLGREERQARSYLDALAIRGRLVRRLTALRRYDDVAGLHPVLTGTRLFYYALKKEQDRWAYYTRADESAPPELLLDPNTWGLKELGSVYPSRDGRYLAYAVEEAGNENPVIKIMDVATGATLGDSLQGWRQYGISWRDDNSGFYYTANPRPGTVPPGEEHYWDAVYFHRLGTPPAQDRKMFFHGTVKEYFHQASVSECGRYVLFYRSRFFKNEVYLQKIGFPADTARAGIVTGFDAHYDVDVVGDKLVILTDSDAPMGRAFVADISRPDRKYWEEIIPAADCALEYVAAVGGKLYAGYSRDAHSEIKIFDLAGNYLRVLELPVLGSAYVWGYWSKPEVWVNFTSFMYPGTTFKYCFEADTLRVFHRPAIDVDLSAYDVRQVWYESKDRTRIPMYVVAKKNVTGNSEQAVYLTGYGGFKGTMEPYFSSAQAVWLESGGLLAIPGLRGGGEYGEEWHKAGMLDKKQNVFDDFIAGAEWLISNRYTRREKLVIGGASNGGLLTGAVLVQRPDLFRAVYCGVPLLDMVRYHKFGYANIWAEEYGSADDSVQLDYLLDYSPYHNVVDGTAYPAVLLVGSDNDARCYPLHAMKMAARLQAAQAGPAPVYLLVRKHAGHGGGTTLTESINEQADIWSFLMDQAGLSPPED